MQTHIDLFTVYRGKLNSLFTEELDLTLQQAITRVEILSDNKVTDEFNWSISRSKNIDGLVDTIFIVPRDQQGIVVAYIELQYGSNHFETFVSPSYRTRFISVTFDLEVDNGTNYTA
ncbi:hypothetical protein [Pseudomonas phage PA1C]|uniref:Uncharacterized protein n=1 Tax=Pseudomonas phage vB_PaeM_PS119XW TaxID=2601632 RepID=A0A5C1K794_9CAUD|nr:hypothetical protein PP933_gp258 [Pseudomonas phage vB_PaeM_PS119XW]QBX32416.1 hypothetical protein [Pseudomonas phage PA1C]QEM41987.1 hypothetical protein [Pseudomonas phage vB_PaeM_PS119XW]